MWTKIHSQRCFYHLFYFECWGIEWLVGHRTDWQIQIKAACGSGLVTAHLEQIFISISHSWLFPCLSCKYCCTNNFASSVTCWLLYNQFKWKEISVPIEKFTFLQLRKDEVLELYFHIKFVVEIKYNVIEVLWR